MTILEQINTDINASRKSRDAFRLGVLQGVKAEMINTSLRKGNINIVLSEHEAVQVLRTQIAQRQASAKEFEDCGAKEKADKELAEGKLLEAYLPTPLEPEALAEIAAAAVIELGATEKKDMSRVIDLVKERTRGRAVGKDISTAVRQALNL